MDPGLDYNKWLTGLIQDVSQFLSIATEFIPMPQLNIVLLVTFPWRNVVQRFG